MKKLTDNYVYIIFEDVNIEKIYSKFINNNIYFECNNNLIKIKEEDLKKVNKYLGIYKYKIIKSTGINSFLKSLKEYKLFIIVFLFSLISIIIISNCIVDIDIVHDDNNIIEIVNNSLKKYDIHKFQFKKSYDELQEIKKNIKNDNLDSIEWIEIEKVGMKYVIKLEKRIINNEQTKSNYCHIYAKKEGLIKGINVSKGEMLVQINDYVKKDDVLISGDIKYNENLVNKVCASGDIYAEGWYEVHVTVPFDYYIKKETGKKRKNIIINYDGKDKTILKDRLLNYNSSKEKIFDAMGIKIYIKHDKEIKKIKRTYSEQEAILKGIEIAKEKVNIKLNKKDKIVNQKVLQKSINNSKIELDIFIITKEQIGYRKSIKES